MHMDGIDYGNLIFLLSTLDCPLQVRGRQGHGLGRWSLSLNLSSFEFDEKLFFFHVLYAFACSVLFEEKYQRGAKEEDGKLQDCSLLLGP